MVSLSGRIQAEVRPLRVGQRLADGAGAVFWLIGWLSFWLLVAVSGLLGLVGAVLRAVGSVVVWCVAGVRLGWADARRRAERRGMAQRWPVRPRKPRAAGGTG